MYVAWVKIDDTLPWIELKGAYQTKADAKAAVRKRFGKIEMRIVEFLDFENAKLELAR